MVGVKPLVETLNCGFAVVYCEITYDPCSLIGSHGCKPNRTIFYALNSIFTSQRDGFTKTTDQILRVV